MGSLYVRNFFKENAKAEADEMVNYIRSEFHNILQTVDWMDQNTRQRAIKKLKAIVAHIGYPKELLIEEELDSIYKNVSLEMIYSIVSLCLYLFFDSSTFRMEIYSII